MLHFSLQGENQRKSAPGFDVLCLRLFSNVWDLICFLFVRVRVPHSGSHLAAWIHTFMFGLSFANLHLLTHNG